MGLRKLAQRANFLKPMPQYLSGAASLASGVAPVKRYADPCAFPLYSTASHTPSIKGCMLC